MDISKALKKEHSKNQTILIVQYIGENRERFAKVVYLVTGKDLILSQRASWVMGIHGEMFPNLILPHLSKLIPLLTKAVHDAVKRNILRVLQYSEIPEKHEAMLLSNCFDLLSSSDAPAAIKAFSITVIVNLAKKYPDLLQELKAWFQKNKSVASKAEIKRMEKAGLLKRD